MPYININEIDNTQYGLSENSNNNIVYCPINAICGTYEPTLITSYDDLIKTYGNTGCANDISFSYVKDIILSGFPVLCKRIEYSDVEKSGTGKADSYTEGTTSKTVEAYAKYHGSYMNNVVIDLEIDEKSGRTAIVTVKKNGSIIESAVFYCSLREDNSPTTTDIALDLRSQILDYEFKYITFWDKEHPKNCNITASGNNAVLTKGRKFNCVLSKGKDLNDSDGKVSEFIMSAYINSQSNETNYEKYLNFLNDKYMWDVKFITAGGYTYPYSDTAQPDEKLTFKGMVTLCKDRQDCFAILDIPLGVDPGDVKSHFDGTTESGIDTTYAAAYAPWCYNKLYDGNKAWMPPSYTFLTNLAQSVKSGTPIYYPPAGVNRMTCRRTIKAEYEIGQQILNKWQPKTNDGQCINPIMRIRGSGYTVYGQRTLINLISPVIATSLKSVTVRFCSIEIKKAIFNASVQLTFEQNILRTWNEFKSKVETTLLEMKKNGGLNSYQIIMDRSTISNSDLNNNIARGIVRCAINDALENFEIGFEISPSYVSFDEEQETLDATLDSNDSLN